MRQSIAAGLLFWATLLSAQPADEPQLSDSVSVSYVMVPFTVLGNKGRPLTDLRKSEVSLLVDGVPVASDMFEKAENAPVSFTILLDGSGSMGLAGKMEAARTALDTLLARRMKGDDFSLWLFDDLQARELVPFTEDPAKIRAAFDRVKPWGKTAFFDALSTMPERSRLGQNPTRAIILLSDGIDNASQLTRDELSKRLEGIAIPIYPLGLRDALDVAAAKTSEEKSDVALLEEVAGLTGGRVFVGTNPEQLALAVDELSRNLRAQYLVGFTPTGKGGVKYRRISLKLAGRIRSVRVRAGYRGTEPPVLRAASPQGKSKSNERKGS